MFWRGFLLICVIYTSLGAHGRRHFRLGRSRGGNLGAPGGPIDVDVELPSAKWFNQKLDHSSASDVRTWEQRYFINDQFYDFKNPGPVFLMIGGEGPADPRWMVKGAWIEYAEKLKAFCVSLEHRFYGESRPTADLSVKNLQYLSSYQALSDLAYFIDAINNRYNFNSDVKWIAFGGSYSGSLAAWLRLEYPHLIYGAVSSSGPLIAKINFYEYFLVVVNALREKTGDEACVNQVKRAHEEIEAMMLIQPFVIDEDFKVCKSVHFASQNDIRNFYSMIADNLADLVQYNEDNRFSTNEKYRNLTINNVCKMMTNTTKQAYENLAAFNSIILEKNNQICLDYSYDNMIKELKNTEWTSEAAEGGRQWTYQTCTEFGFYQTSSGDPEVFGNDFSLDFFTQQCVDIFGTKFNGDFVTRAVEWTNNKYGGTNIPINRVIYVHGSVDPWHALGITSTAENNSPAIYIKGTAHCANMYPSSENDSVELKEARVEIEQYLRAWLGFP